MSRLTEMPWNLWLRQVVAIMRLELRKSFFGKRSVLLYLVALAPLFPISLLIVASLITGVPEPLKEIGPTEVFAKAVYHGFIVRFSLYLGCVWVFMNLFRGEILDRSLHYYFLVPVRREVLVAGKFVSGWAATTLLYGAVTAGSFVLLHLVFGVGEAQRYLAGRGAFDLAAYVGVTALGCLGYGALFVMLGMFFRSPVIPALIFWLWEWILFVMPAVLKQVSVIHYLQSLSPHPVTEGTVFAFVGETTSLWIALPGLLLFSAAAMAVASWRVRRLEIHYSTD